MSSNDVMWNCGFCGYLFFLKKTLECPFMTHWGTGVSNSFRTLNPGIVEGGFSSEGYHIMVVS
jgi:hypothetical protein